MRDGREGEGEVTERGGAIDRWRGKQEGTPRPANSPG